MAARPFCHKTKLYLASHTPEGKVQAGAVMVRVRGWEDGMKDFWEKSQFFPKNPFKIFLLEREFFLIRKVLVCTASTCSIIRA
jgi:hypothetical protein